MNRMDNSEIARIRYLDADFQVITQGRYVVCAITGEKIQLEDLKYWSVERQEPYIDAQASYTAEMQSKA